MHICVNLSHINDFLNDVINMWVVSHLTTFLMDATNVKRWVFSLNMWNYQNLLYISMFPTLCIWKNIQILGKWRHQEVMFQYTCRSHSTKEMGYQMVIPVRLKNWWASATWSALTLHKTRNASRLVLVVPKLVMRTNGSFSHGQKQEQHGQHPCQQNKRKTSRIETVTCSHLLLLNHTQTHNGIEQAIGDAGTLHHAW